MSIDKKNLLAKCLYYSGFYRMANLWNNNDIVVINYHRIKTSQKSHFSMFDDGVFGPDQYEFEKQMSWLKKNIQILSEEDLINVVNNKFKPSKRSVVITFDDGYIDNYTLAYPILRHYKIPAIFFIPSQTIDERCLSWWDCFAYFLKKTEKDKIVLFGERLYPKQQYEKSLSFILNLVYQNKVKDSDVYNSLCAACDVDPISKDIQDRELMSWDQLKEVADNGIDIGAHTHSHRILSSLNPKQQHTEIINSKKIIEQHIGRNIRSMSYPVGSYNHFTETTKKIVRKAGFDLAFSFLNGVNSCGIIDAMDIKRIGVKISLPRFVCNIELHKIFAPLNKF